MEHVAIDLGGKESQICARRPDGTICDEQRVLTNRLAAYLKGRPHSRVIVETCAEAFRVADAAQALGHEVRVVPATLVGTLGVGARRTKTDRRDAQILSEVSCRIDLPSVHVPPLVTRQRRSLCTAREALIAARTMLINSVRGWARQEAMSIRTGKTCTFPKRVRDRALSTEQGLPQFIERMLTIIESLNEQIARADQEISSLATEDPLCQRLMTVPGVGPVTSIRFVSALDDVSRFPSAHAVQAFLGLTPGEHSSSLRKRRTGITKAGPPAVRRALGCRFSASWVHEPGDFCRVMGPLVTQVFQGHGATRAGG